MAHKSLMALASAMLLFFATTAEAARCGKSAAGFEKWKRAFAKEARANGIGQRGLNALKGTRYAYGTIKADRGQHSFKLSLNQFMKKRGASAIASQAGFGRYMGRQNTLSAVATLAYDCRRPEFFTEHLYAALQLIDQRRLAAGQRGAMHGEVGHTQFLPKSVLLYAVDGDGNGRADLNSKADALASTANFLRGHGWQPGAGYQPGQPNFRAIQGWNAAGVYQQTIAIVGRQIDGG
jgi:membrane-bound lytic murein transglycosylase B